MPIRLNLLAEAQAAEDMRRRDPVKRAIWLGSLLATGMLVWASSVYGKTLLAKYALNQTEGQIARGNNDYQQVVAHQRKIDENKKKLAALRQLTTNRFLQGNLLDALQQITMEDVQLMRVRVDQTYGLTEELKPKTNSAGKITPGKPAMVKENIGVTLEARDTSPVPGDRVNKLKDAISTNTYFLPRLSTTNGVRLTFVSPPTVLPDTKPFVLFTIECRYPEKLR
jgi:hypothetical protein